MTPFVLVPGLLSTGEIFAPQIGALSPFGPVTTAYTLEGSTMAEIAAAILRQAPPRFALGGISMGGYVSFEILRQAPERVLALALIDTTARPDLPAQSENRRAMVASARAAGIDGFDAVVRPMLDSLLHPAHLADDSLRATLLRMARAVGVEGLARQQNAIMGRPDSRPLLSSIAVPTVVLVGDGDKLTPVDRAEEMASAVPNARLVVVPECGHASTLERPAAVNAALAEWASLGARVVPSPG